MPTTPYSVTEAAWVQIGTAPCVVECKSVQPTLIYVGSAMPALDTTATHVVRNDDPDGYPVMVPGDLVFARALALQSNGTIDAIAVPGGPSEAFIGKVGGNTRIKTGVIIRPADTTAYAVGDLIGASTTAGASNVMTIPGATRVPGGTGRVIRARVATNQAAFSGTIRLHLFKTLVAPTVGDNGVLTGTVPNYINAYGPTDVTLGQGIFSDGSKGYMAFSPPIAFDVPDAQSDIYVILEARTVFTPASGQRFSVTLECDVD